MPIRLSRPLAAAAAVTIAGLFTAPAAVAAPDANPALTPVVATPELNVLERSGPLAPGYLFTGPKIEGTVPPGAPIGAEISDNSGHPVWFQQSPDGASPADVRVQQYRGKPVLTFWVGKSLSGPGHGQGTDYILNPHYQVIATVNAGKGLDADQHEFWLTDRGTALITSYHQTVADTSSIGGPTNQQVFEGVVQEIDVRTGKVLLDWHSLDHIPVSASHQPLPASADIPWDYFHINAVRPDTDGNLIVNARHTWAMYKIDRQTGAIIWTLGGKTSSFVLGKGVKFAWQHDPQPEGDGVYRIFDNESNGVAVRPATRIITVKVDTQHGTATLLSSLTHPDKLLAASQGNSQLLPNGDLLVGWGQTGRVSEFSPGGRLLFDASVPTAEGYDTYRAYRFPWHGAPLTKPTLSVGDGQVDAIWNGATDVVTWQLLGGDTASALHPVRAFEWNGLDTPATLTDPPAYLQLLARDADGQVIGRSAVVPG